jgi:hypothetical protein
MFSTALDQQWIHHTMASSIGAGSTSIENSLRCWVNPTLSGEPRRTCMTQERVSGLDRHLCIILAESDDAVVTGRPSEATGEYAKTVAGTVNIVKANRFYGRYTSPRAHDSD